jgi:hypothetical protein
MAVQVDLDAEEGILRKWSEESTDLDFLAVQWLVKDLSFRLHQPARLAV